MSAPLNYSRIHHLAATDDLAPLVLELLKQLCRDQGLDVHDVVSPTAPPRKQGGISTGNTLRNPTAVDNSGVPTTTEVIDRADDDSGESS